MARCSTMLLACLALLAASRLAAQTRAAVTLSVAIPVVLQLETVTPGSTAAAGGSQADVAEVVLRVSANSPWQLVPVVPAGAPAVAVRAAVAGGAGAGFQPLAGGVPVATGGRGRAIEVVVQYRLPPGAAPPPVSYRLEPAGA